MDDKFEQELFARQKRHAERTMKIVVAMLAVVFLSVLYFLLQGG